MHTSSLYWFTLTTRATSSSQKPLGNPLSNQTRLQTPHTKVVTLNPSRNTLPLANHTKSIDLEHLKNTQHSLAIQQQKYKRLRKDYTWSKYNMKRIQLQSYFTLTWKSKAWCESWKLEIKRLVKTFNIIQRLVKTFNKGMYSVRNHLRQIHHSKQDPVRIFKVETTKQPIDLVWQLSQPSQTTFSLFQNI